MTMNIQFTVFSLWLLPLVMLFDITREFMLCPGFNWESVHSMFSLLLSDGRMPRPGWTSWKGGPLPLWDDCKALGRVAWVRHRLIPYIVQMAIKLWRVAWGQPVLWGWLVSVDGQWDVVDYWRPVGLLAGHWLVRVSNCIMGMYIVIEVTIAFFISVFHFCLSK